MYIKNKMKFFKIIIFAILFIFFNQKTFADIDISARHVILQDHFSGKIHETFLPFRVSLPDLNLFYNVHIKKDNARLE